MYNNIRLYRKAVRKNVPSYYKLIIVIDNIKGTKHTRTDCWSQILRFIVGDRNLLVCVFGYSKRSICFVFLLKRLRVH